MTTAIKRNRILPHRLLLALFALLCASLAAHAAHHLADPLCGAGKVRDGHPCLVCSALDGGAVAEPAAALAAPAEGPKPLPRANAERGAPAPRWTSTSPRAPPAA